MSKAALRKKIDIIISSETSLPSEMVENVMQCVEAYADQEVKEPIGLLEKFTRGFEWDMTEKPETLDKADYEFYDEVKAYLNKLNTE